MSQALWALPCRGCGVDIIRTKREFGQLYAHYCADCCEKQEASAHIRGSLYRDVPTHVTDHYQPEEVTRLLRRA